LLVGAVVTPSKTGLHAKLQEICWMAQLGLLQSGLHPGREQDGAERWAAEHGATFIRFDPPVHGEVDASTAEQFRAMTDGTNEWLSKRWCGVHHRAGGDELLEQLEKALADPSLGRVVFVFDGGGAKGVIAMAVVRAIEKRLGRNIADIADLMGGTSIGAAAVLVLALAPNRGIAVDVAEELIVKLMTDVFGTGRNSTTNLYDLDRMESYFLAKLELNPDDVIPAPNPGDGTPGSKMPHIFLVGSVHQTEIVPANYGEFLITNYHRPHAPGRQQARWSRSWTPWMGLRTSAAAPTIFTHVMVGGMCFVDGGITRNCPVMLAIEELMLQLKGVL